MTYQLIKEDNKIINIRLIADDGKEYLIPLDEANTDFQEYIAWTKASPKNVAAPADE